jgi:hypothetical protein
MFQQKPVEITKSGDRDLGLTDGQRRARSGIQHPRRDDYAGAMLALNEDDISPTALLRIEQPDGTTIESVPPIVDGHLLVDMGRITSRWSPEEKVGCSATPLPAPGQAP